MEKQRHGLQKHARLPYNDMQMYLTTIERGICDRRRGVSKHIEFSGLANIANRRARARVSAAAVASGVS